MRDFERVLYSSEVRELAEEVGLLFEELDRTATELSRPPGHCTPTLDVLETDESLEIVVDLPGVRADRLRVMLTKGTLLVVGEKCSPYVGEERHASFQLVERGFGRFARAVRLEGSFDGGRTKAEVRDGELRIVVPKIAERRGREIRIPVIES
jgi:HSP20 family protein